MTTIGSASAWIANYQPVDLNTVLVRQWKQANDLRNPIEIIKELPDHQKPHLPEGHIWFENGKDLEILRHLAAPSPDFKIYLFGPDENKATGDKRVQYIVAERNRPIHGFAMTKREGFPKDLRDEFPVPLASFKAGQATYWRGHVIDYLDTLGSVDQKMISTLFPLNYKPEPEGAWARNLRAHLVKDLRNSGGTYSELMLYGFSPQKTDGAIPIPAAVCMETFTYDHDHLKSYYVPKDHECHKWTASGQKNFARNSLKTLEQEDTFPALVVKKGETPQHGSVNTKNTPSDYKLWNVKEGYQLRQAAELERDSATYQLGYSLYGKVHDAPDDTLTFWLGRAVSTAEMIDETYKSKMPPFPLSMVNTVTTEFTEPFLSENLGLKSLVARLTTIASNIMAGTSPPKEIKAEPETPKTPQKAIQIEEAGSSSKTPEPSSPNRSPSKKTPSPITISCKGTSPRTPAAITELMGRLTPLMADGPIILSDVSTELGKTLLPMIEASTKESPHKPLAKVEVINPRYKGKVSELVKNLFGNDVPVE